MNPKNRIIFMCFVTLLITSFVPAPVMSAAKVPGTPTLQSSANFHLPFVQNKGQVADPTVAYVADTFACQVRVTKDGQIVYRLPEKEAAGQQTPEIREQMTGATIHVHGIDKQAATVNYYPGRDASKWLTNLPSYARVGVGRTADGIHLELKAHSQNVEKLFRLQPGADPSAIRMTVQGAKELQVNSKGELELTTPSGAMRFTAPMAYQDINGTRHPVSVHYQVGQGGYGFALGKYDRAHELVIDPLVKVFPVDSKKNNAIQHLAADDEGHVFAAGYTNRQLAIFKLDRRLENILATAFFSEDVDYNTPRITSLALDSQGNLFAGGTTEDLSFPITPEAYDKDIGCSLICYDEGFVIKFSNDLKILASTFIGGYAQDGVYDMAINAKDQVYIAGYTYYKDTTDENFPITSGAYDTVHPPSQMAKMVVARLSNDLSQVQAATYLGGSIQSVGVDKRNPSDSNNNPNCLVLDSQGYVWVAGRTILPDFPVTTGSLSNKLNGKGDLFLVKLDEDLTQLYYGSYIGGINDEFITDMLLDSQDNIYLLGYTRSQDFPMVTGGFDTSYGNGSSDGFILKLNPAANRIIASTFLGGTYNGSGYSEDIAAAMDLTDDESELLVVGRTESNTFPTTDNCWRPGASVDSAGVREVAIPNREINVSFDYGDGFLTVLSSDLSSLLYSSLYGTRYAEYFDDVIWNVEDIVVAGEINDPNFNDADTFPLMPSSDYSRDVGVVLRFNKDETQEEPEEPASSSSSGGGSGGGGSGGGGGGGGGCFIATCR